MKREISVLMLASLATNALDEVYGMTKVHVTLIIVAAVVLFPVQGGREAPPGDGCFLSRPDLAPGINDRKAFNRFLSFNVPRVYWVQSSLIFFSCLSGRYF